MIYINYLMIYSIFGFLMESTLYKITGVTKQSGILYGPYTLVYGFGVLISILCYEFLEKHLKFKRKIFKIIFYFFLFTVTLSLTELIGGNLLQLIFKVDLWNYSNHQDAIGKYICLTNSLIWGILGSINIYFLYPRLKKIFLKFPSIYTLISLACLIIDIVISLIITRTI